jgi:hypothetical protein
VPHNACGCEIAAALAGAEIHHLRTGHANQRGRGFHTDQRGGQKKNLGAKGILVNAVQPGPVTTELNPESGENAAYQKARTALDRFGRPEEIAALIVWARWPLPHGFRKPILCLALSVSPTEANGLIGDL